LSAGLLEHGGGKAALIQNPCNGWDLARLDFMFMGNGGSLVYPAYYDFVENSDFLLLSVTAGEDQPAKYLANLPSADVTIITKPDLADAVECEGAAAGRNIQDVRPGTEVSRPSAKTGEGLAEFLELLENWRGRSRAAAAV
jgi:hydrogenase nickel incorporation protein HypB